MLDKEKRDQISKDIKAEKFDDALKGLSELDMSNATENEKGSIDIIKKGISALKDSEGIKFSEFVNLVQSKLTSGEDPEIVVRNASLNTIIRKCDISVEAGRIVIS